MAGERYFESLCNINWHLLPLADQKTLNILMSAAIQPKPITIVIKEINLGLFVEVKP